MTDRELLALMAATLWCSDRGKAYNFGYDEAVEAAENIIEQIDARAAARRESALPECPPKPD